jgi:hypothetical protein
MASQQELSSLPSSSLVWFLLVDSTTGEPYKGTSIDYVSLPSTAVIAQFRDAAHLKNSNKLSSVDAADLLVYKNKRVFSERPHRPLKVYRLLDHYGKTAEEDDMLVVVVPSSRGPSQSTSESSPTNFEPNPHRKQRWMKLNAILEENAKKSKTNDSTAYSYVSWNQVKTVFNPTNYVQPRRDIDDAQLDLLTRYLSNTTKCFGDVTTGKEAKRLHFIAPVLICVCYLFDGDVDIVVEEELVGKIVKAHGHFEFMLRRGDKAICIVEAKKDDVEQGMAQDLVGCEVAADVGRLNIVYGIVTNYIQWNFFRSLDDKVEKEECSLSITPEGPERDSLKKITEKIYAMLSN